jgi:hypothetical protein
MQHKNQKRIQNVSNLKHFVFKKSEIPCNSVFKYSLWSVRVIMAGWQTTQLKRWQSGIERQFVWHFCNKFNIQVISVTFIHVSSHSNNPGIFLSSSILLWIRSDRHSSAVLIRAFWHKNIKNFFANFYTKRVH